MQRRLHGEVRRRRQLFRSHEGFRQVIILLRGLLPKAVRIVAYLQATGLRFAFTYFPRRFQRVNGLDATGNISGKQADRACRCDRDQMAVSHAVPGDVGLQAVGKSPYKWGVEVFVFVEQRERAFVAGQRDRCLVGRVANRRHDFLCKRAPIVAVVGKTQHGERVREARYAEADATRVARLLCLLLQRETGDVDYVVEKTHRDVCGVLQFAPVKFRFWCKWRLHQRRQVYRAEIAGTVRWQRDLSTGICRANRLAIVEIVVSIDAVDE